MLEKLLLGKTTRELPKVDHTHDNVSLATRQHYRLCVLRMKYRKVHSTGHLEIDGLSILK